MTDAAIDAPTGLVPTPNEDALPRRLADFYRRVFEVKTVSEDDSLIRLTDLAIPVDLVNKPSRGYSLVFRPD